MILEWTIGNKMMINKDKSGIMRLRKRVNQEKIGDIEGIRFVKSYKYLGV